MKVTTIDNRTVELEEDNYAQAQREAEDHLVRCWDWFYEQQDGEEPKRDDPAIAPFCGCMTCQVRETLAAATPFLEVKVS